MLERNARIDHRFGLLCHKWQVVLPYSIFMSKRIENNNLLHNSKAQQTLDTRRVKHNVTMIHKSFKCEDRFI